MVPNTCLFKSFWQAGFECSTQLLRSGKRLDVVSESRHDRFVEQDFQRLRDLGLFTAREGVRWHSIEICPRHYDFSSALHIIKAARKYRIQIIWDLLHFGWPSHIEIFSADWVSSFTEFALAFIQLLKTDTDDMPFLVPVNEISFLSWAGGEVGYLNPFVTGRGLELKFQLVRASIAASDAILSECPNARLIAPEPVIHVAGNPEDIHDILHAEWRRSLMFEAWDMLGGHIQPDLGGSPRFLDILGLNYYPLNQRWSDGGPIFRGDKNYRPFRDLITEISARYRRPMLISETGSEGCERPGWLNYVATEARAARDAGADIHGICLYPILNHPGWDDGRHCHNGLWDYADELGSREIFSPLADELARQKNYDDTPMPLSSYSIPNQPDMLCFSHLRWNFVFQRPQHLMGRFARNRRVFFIEEPVYNDSGPRIRATICNVTGVVVVTPHLQNSDHQDAVVAGLLSSFASANQIDRPVLWFYTPMALDYLPDDISPAAIVYDCMDELSMFKGAPPRISALELRLFQIASLVFTGGMSLFEAKRSQHPRVYAFPSGVDVSHFAQSQNMPRDFQEHRHIPEPRLGYAGVIDERIDMALISDVASQRPAWQFVMIGPTAKIGPESLPRRANIHWLGMKNYADLPSYFAGWNIGIMPFALNDATRFISPTKTPEYLSAGLPVISTPIHDVVRPYGELGLAKIAGSAAEFIEAVETLLGDQSNEWQAAAESFLKTISWDAVWEGMDTLTRNATDHKSDLEIPVRLLLPSDAEVQNV